MFWGRDQVRTVLVKGSASTVSTLGTVLASCSTKAWVTMTVGVGVSGALSLDSWTSSPTPGLSSIFVRGSSVLFIFSLAAAPPDKSPLLVLVRQLPPERDRAVPGLTVRRFPRHVVTRHHVVTRRLVVRHEGGRGSGCGHQAGRPGREYPGHRSIGDQSAATPTGATPPATGPVRQEPVAPRSHPLSLSLVNLWKTNE